MSRNAAAISYIGFLAVAAWFGLLWWGVPWDNPAYQQYMFHPRQKDLYAAIAAVAALLAGVSVVLGLRAPRTPPPVQR
jgi:hypothetical protein